MDKFKACVKVKLKENKVAIMYSIDFFFHPMKGIIHLQTPLELTNAWKHQVKYKLWKTGYKIALRILTLSLLSFKGLQHVSQVFLSPRAIILSFGNPDVETERIAHSDYVNHEASLSTISYYIFWGYYQIINWKKNCHVISVNLRELNDSSLFVKLSNC